MTHLIYVHNACICLLTKMQKYSFSAANSLTCLLYVHNACICLLTKCKNIVFQLLTRVSFHYLCFRSINVLLFLTKKSEKKGEIEIYFDQKSDKTKNTPRGTFVSWGQNIQYHIPIPQIQEKVYVRDHNLRTNEIFSDKLQPKIMLWKKYLLSR